jgi:hypothetical protein
MLWPYFIVSTNFTMCINMSCEDKSHAHEHIRHTTVKRSDPKHGCLFRAAAGRAVEPKDVPTFIRQCILSSAILNRTFFDLPWDR